ncbi:MAG: hypothetical protein WBC91_12765 [Phototrophicaceae bacterium]
MTMDTAEIQAYTAEIAKMLGEKDDKPISQIAAMVEHIGREFVQTRVDETNKIEEAGGMKTDDGKRRRTKGGVFFYLCKGKMTDEQRAVIFPHFGQKGRVVEWEERHEFIDDLVDDEDLQGNMRYVTIHLHGRPGKVVKEDHSIMTTIKHVHKKTPLPKGVPHPPLTPTIYTVYMSRKHWEGVEESINEYKSDRLIIEGTLFYDGETESIAVFANSVTTRRIEKLANKAKNEDAPEASKNDTASSNEASASAQAEPEENEPVTADSKLEKLYSAAEKLRSRIAEMEEKGQRGVNMTKQLLRNTEKQIEVLEKSKASD